MNFNKYDFLFIFMFLTALFLIFSVFVAFDFLITEDDPFIYSEPFFISTINLQKGQSFEINAYDGGLDYEN